MATDSADRQKTIDIVTQRLLSVTTGHDEAEARAVATDLVDEAIAKRDGTP